MSSFPISGVRVGHSGRVTVVLFPAGAVGSAEVRGGAPATREIDVLDPARTVARIDAVVFAGGSAFGLVAADGVMRYLAERGQGYATAARTGADRADRVRLRPRRLGRRASERRRRLRGRGRRGARRRTPAWAGWCRVERDGGKVARRVRARCPAASASASRTVDGATVAALAVVNAVGDVVADDGRVLAGSTAPADAPPFPSDAPFEERANTTLVVLVTDALCDKAACFLLAQSAHDGFARAIRPAHTRFDGDLAIAVSAGAVEASIDRLRIAAADVVADAIRDCAR